MSVRARGSRCARRLLRAVVVAAFACAAPRGLAAQEAGSPPDRCPIYLAAWDEIFGRDTAVVVLYDSTSLATPTFAFHGWAGMRFTEPDSVFTVTDSLWQAMRAALAPRGPLPVCLEQQRRVRRAPYAEMQAPFRDRTRGWEAFVEAFPGARRLGLMSHVLPLGGDDAGVLVYVASASHWLSGGGDLLLLRPRDGRWAVVARKAIWRS